MYKCHTLRGSYPSRAIGRGLSKKPTSHPDILTFLFVWERGESLRRTRGSGRSRENDTGIISVSDNCSWFWFLTWPLHMSAWILCSAIQLTRHHFIIIMRRRWGDLCIECSITYLTISIAVNVVTHTMQGLCPLSMRAGGTDYSPSGCNFLRTVKL